MTDFDISLNKEQVEGLLTNKDRSRAAAILSCSCTSPVKLAI